MAYGGLWIYQTYLQMVCRGLNIPQLVRWRNLFLARPVLQVHRRLNDLRLSRYVEMYPNDHNT